MITHCAKCGAELIGKKNFCAACGAPTVDPRAPSPAAAPSAPASAPSAGAATRDSGYGPVSAVNPFAQTAPPGTKSPAYGPLPAPSDPDKQISPLAVSNLVSQRAAFAAVGGAAVAAAQAAAPKAPSEPPKKIPGTQVMPSSRMSPPAPASSAPAPSPQPRTAMMQSVPGSFPNPPAAPLPPSSVAAHPPAPAQPMFVPSPGVPITPMGAAPPFSGLPQPNASPPAPTNPRGPFGGGWSPQPQAAPYAWPAMAPGMRVQVTWANGQRYPGTIQQISGTQCLVVFPDGRQQWVEMQYVSPG